MGFSPFPVIVPVARQFDVPLPVVRTIKEEAREHIGHDGQMNHMHHIRVYSLVSSTGLSSFEYWAYTSICRTMHHKSTNKKWQGSPGTESADASDWRKSMKCQKLVGAHQTRLGQLTYLKLTNLACIRKCIEHHRIKTLFARVSGVVLWLAAGPKLVYSIFGSSPASSQCSA